MPKQTPIDWSHWSALHAVTVWEAALLSLDIDPGSMVEDQYPDFTNPGPWFISGSFASHEQEIAYQKRLRAICDAMDVGQVKVLGEKVPNQSVWRIHLGSFSRWASKRGLVTAPEFKGLAGRPDEMSATLSGDAVRPTASEVPPTREPWMQQARVIGEKVRQENKHLNLEKIAEHVHKEMKLRHARGEAGFTGRGGNVPGAATIRRHALMKLG